MIALIHSLARALLAAALPRDLREAVLGDLDDEMAERIRAGATREQAMRWSIRQSFGSIPPAVTARLDRRALRSPRASKGNLMHSLWQDVRYAGRMMRKSPLITSAAIATLSIGIGATTAIFSVVHAALLRELPYPEPDRLVRVYETFRGLRTRGVTNPSNFDYWERHATSFSHIAAMRSMRATLTGAGEPAEVSVQAVSPSFSDTIGVLPAIGRPLRPADAEGTAAPVLISHDLWQERFGGDPAIVSRTLTLNGSARPIAGVMPEGFRFPHETDVWQALALSPGDRANARAWFLGVVARLKPGLSVPAAQAELDTLARQLQDAHPARQKGRGAHLVALQEDLAFGVADSLKVLQGAVGLVLLIAVANVANLLLAHGAARHREFSIRTAVGATRRRILRQLLTESLLLGLTGAAGGALLAVWGVRALTAMSPLRLPLEIAPSIDGTVLAFTLTAGLVTSLLFGIAPAFVAARTNVAGPIQEHSHSVPGGGRRTARFRAVLVIAEVALAVVLLAGAGLLMRSFAALLSQDVGFSGERLLTAYTTLPASRYDSRETRAQFWRELFARLETIPDVTAVGGSTALPFSNFEWQTDFRILGRENVPNDGTSIRTVSPGYFAALGIPILSGRILTDRDNAGSEPAVMVNEAFARAHLDGASPVGHRIRFSRNPDAPPAVIVGVAGNTRHYRLSEPPVPEVYRPLAQEPPQMLILAIKTSQDPRSAISLVRSAVHDTDRDLPVERIVTMEALIARTVADRRFYFTLMGFFAAFAVLLALIGVYSVMAYVVGQRSREIGIRMALGAAPWQVRRAVLGSGAALVATGVTLGTGGALFSTRVLQSLLFGVTPRDPFTLLGAIVLLATFALAAAYVPARRAGKLDPAAALRQP